VVLAGCTFARQVPDDEFRFAIVAPRYPEGTGPRVAIDSAHGNFHTVDGRFGPFARLLEDDGYRVSGLDSSLTEESLADVDVLVIANPLAAENRRRWRLPNPSAFTEPEIQNVRRWVEEGGALLLIADHLPFPGAAESMAASFGVFFANGYAEDGEGEMHLVFRREGGTLRDHPVTDGRTADRRVDQVKVFTGQAFRLGSGVDGDPILVLPAGSRVLLPSKPRDFDQRTPYVLGEGLMQGALVRVGTGRLAVFGEASMFTAQLAIRRKSTTPIGMSAEGAEQNPRLVLNVLEWLSAAAGL
jgi:hypothetical protein